MRMRSLLLYLAVISLAVVTTPTLCSVRRWVRGAPGGGEVDVTEAEIPLKLAGKFATLTSQTESASNLMFDRKLYQIEATATTISTPKKRKAKMFESVPEDDPEDVTINYQIKFANAAATPLACGSLDWVENPIVQCWELSPKLSVGYTAEGMTVNWVTPEGKRRVASFAPRMELQDVKTIDVMVSATDSDDAFTVSFVIVHKSANNHKHSVFSFMVNAELGSIAVQHEDRDRILLQKKAKIVSRRGGERTVVCTLVQEPLTPVQIPRRFRVSMEIYNENRHYKVDEFTEWTGVPTIDLFSEESESKGSVTKLYYYRPQTGFIREMMLPRITTKSPCTHDYPLAKFGENLDARQTRHWTWRHTPANGFPTITHAFLTQENELYLIPQKVFSPRGIVAVEQAKYSVFVMVSGKWELKRQASLPPFLIARSDNC